MHDRSPVRHGLDRGAAVTMVLLGGQVSAALIAALVLIAGGIVLVNRPQR